MESVRGAAKAINDLAEEVPSAVVVSGNGSGPFADFGGNSASAGSVGEKYKDQFDDFAAAASGASTRAQNALNRLSGAIKVLSGELDGFVTAVQTTDEDAARTLSSDWSDK